MALELIASPLAWPSAHGNAIFTLKDADKVTDPATYPNFKFVADVFVGGAPGHVATLKAVPDPSRGIGIFNAGNICRNYVSAPFDPVELTLLSQEWFNYMSLRMVFSEEWSFTPGPDTIDTDFILFFNSYEGRATSGTIGVLLNKYGEPATNRPDNINVFFNSPSLFIPFFPHLTDPVPIIIVPTGGGFPLTTSYTPSGAYKMALLNLCPQVINSLQPGTITPATTSYTIHIGSRTFVVSIICESIYKPYAIHFLNQYGGFDTKLFTKVNRANVTIAKTDYGKLPYTVDADGAVTYKSINGIYPEQRSTYASLFQEKMTLNTDLLTDQEYIWLRELLISPLVYLEDENGLFPIAITDTDYESKKVVNDGLTNLAINIQFGNQLNAQFR